MTETLLVTGATGTVGEPLVRDLLGRDASVRVATRDPERARDGFGDEPERVEFDLGRPETWGETLAGVDGMFLLFPPGRGAMSAVCEFANAAARVGVDRDEIFVPAGDGVLSFTDARDVAAVAATVLTEFGHENRAYDLTGPTALDFREVAEVFSDALDRPIRYADPSRPTFGWQMYRRGVSPGLVAFMIAEYSVVRLGFSGRTTDDVETLLGRPPRTVREFVGDYADEFRT